MAGFGRYDISGSSFVQRLEEQTTRYNNLIRQAERTNIANGGNPTKEEATLYYQAAKVCEEIMNMDLSQRAIVSKWKLLRQDCEDNVKRITNLLAPPPPPPPPRSMEETDTQPGPASERTAPPAGGKKEPQKTKSGFTTKNAVRDVTAETIESWYKEKPRHGLDDVSGMESLKKRLMNEVASLGWSRIDEALKISPVQSYFFYGPPGTGKTFLIEAFANELMDKGFKYIRLLGGDIHASLVGVAEKTVQIAFQEAIDNEPCLIFIDEVEDVCVDRNNMKAEGHEKRLTVAFLEAYNLLRESGKRVIFMGATNHPGQVDEAMLDRVKLVRIPLPDEPSRESYFARNLNALVLEDGFTYGEMAAATENYSYRDLTSLKDTIAIKTKHQAIEDYKVTAPDGGTDVEKTDIAASEALRDGRVRLTRALFMETKKELPPSDKSRMQEELRVFEERVAALAG